MPQLSRVVALRNPANPFTAIAWKAMQSAAALGVQLQPVEARGPQDLDRAFATITEAGPDGLIIIPDRFLLTYRASSVPLRRTIECRRRRLRSRFAPAPDA